MAYLKSGAQSGLGWTLGIGSTPTIIGEIRNIKPSNPKWEQDEVTNLQSAAKEYINTIIDWGDMSIECNRVSTDAGQVAVLAAFQSGAATPFTMTAIKESGETTTPDKLTFTALVTECSLIGSDIEAGKAVPLSFKLKITGGVTYTQGA